MCRLLMITIRGLYSYRNRMVIACPVSAPLFIVGRQLICVVRRHRRYMQVRRAKTLSCYHVLSWSAYLASEPPRRDDATQSKKQVVVVRASARSVLSCVHSACVPSSLLKPSTNGGNQTQTNRAKIRRYSKSRGGTNKWVSH